MKFVEFENVDHANHCYIISYFDTPAEMHSVEEK